MLDPVCSQRFAGLNAWGEFFISLSKSGRRVIGTDRHRKLHRHGLVLADASTVTDRCKSAPLQRRPEHGHWIARANLANVKKSQAKDLRETIQTEADMTHPYANLAPEAFWRTAVAEPGADGLENLWPPKFAITPEDRIATAGSCFAQHLGRALAERGFSWTDFEPAPPFLNDEDARDHNYGIFSFRTGNIYTPKMLIQWFAQSLKETSDTGEIWEHEGRFFDPMRPAIEPGGFASAREVETAREVTLTALRRAVHDSDVFVFTLGLTESWRNSQTDFEYALCPGTLAGQFDPSVHEFVNTGFRGTYAGMRKAIRMMRSVNRNLRFLLTVSPVPLTATASNKHVLVATQYSKSVLRAAAGQLANDFPFVDYFPSFEIITHPIFEGRFFASNKRSVLPEGVDTVMQHFFAGMTVTNDAANSPAKPVKSDPPPFTTSGEDDLRCEEALLDAFAR